MHDAYLELIMGLCPGAEVDQGTDAPPVVTLSAHDLSTLREGLLEIAVVASGVLDNLDSPMGSAAMSRVSGVVLAERATVQGLSAWLDEARFELQLPER